MLMSAAWYMASHYWSIVNIHVGMHRGSFPKKKCGNQIAGAPGSETGKRQGRHQVRAQYTHEHFFILTQKGKFWCKHGKFCTLRLKLA